MTMDFQGVNLQGSRMYEAHFERASFETIDNTYCKAHLEGIGAQYSFFQDALLEGAYLNDADFTGADLSRADLKNADLRDPVLTDAVLKDAVANKATRWPDGFDPKAQGVKLEE
jgi:uncharacterized protein YjbI with pentapeptide repeats